AVVLPRAVVAGLRRRGRREQEDARQGERLQHFHGFLLLGFTFTARHAADRRPRPGAPGTPRGRLVHLVYRTLTVARTTPMYRSTSTYFCWTRAPRPTASAERLLPAGSFGSSPGGGGFVGHAAANVAVITPVGAVLRSSAAALLA